MSDRKKTASPESAYATWHDPSTYDHMRMGPPYLPGQQVRKAGVSKQAASEIGAEVREMVAAEKQAADEELVGLLGHFQNDYQDAPFAELAALLSFLRALLVVHQTHHWQSQGSNSYGDHLLFDRLYNETLPLVDSLAERTVGAGSTILVNPIIQSAHTAAIIKSVYNGAPIDPGPDALPLLSLKGVLRFLLLLRMVYEALETKGLLPAASGTANLLQGIADQHESFAYLLKQRASSKTANVRVAKSNWKK
jgi:DNA-binding ferritin-like protein